MKEQYINNKALKILKNTYNIIIKNIKKDVSFSLDCLSYKISTDIYYELNIESELNKINEESKYVKYYLLEKSKIKKDMHSIELNIHLDRVKHKLLEEDIYFIEQEIARLNILNF